MSLITIDELKTHVETDLTDAALQRIIDSQEALIVRRLGAHEVQCQVFSPNYQRVLYPYRKVSSITSIVEEVGDTETTLAADDYAVTADGRRIDRKQDGTNPRRFWGERVTVTYAPEGQADERKMVLIDLCKLTIEYNAKKSESTGDHSESAKDYTKEREEVLSSLAPTSGLA
jgi:hypothetical protein